MSDCVADGQNLILLLPHGENRARAGVNDGPAGVRLLPEGGAPGTGVMGRQDTGAGYLGQLV